MKKPSLHLSNQLYTCRTQRRGNWVLFTYAHCPDFETRINLQTGEWAIRHWLINARHIDDFIPMAILYAFKYQN